MVRIVPHEEQGMIPYTQKERCHILGSPYLRASEYLKHRQPGGVDPYSCFDCPPGSTRERLFRHERGVLDEFVRRPGLTERVHLIQKFLRVFLVFCQCVGPCKALPVDSAEKRPGPFVVPASLRGGIEHPVNGSVELMTENVVLHDLLCILYDSIIPDFPGFGC